MSRHDPLSPEATAERGATLIIATIGLTVLFIAAAIVVDMGAMRIDAREAQSSADFAAIAAAADLDPARGGSPLGACRSAWAYVTSNVPGFSGSDPCSTFASAGPCDDSTSPRSAVGTAGPYRVTITTPVPDGAPELEGRGDALIDGGRCERIAVTVERTRDYMFAPVMQATAGAVIRSAVARGFTGSSSQQGVPLVVLDPVGCRAFTASGQATVIIKAAAGGTPGGLVVDSAGTLTGSGNRTCANSNDYVIDALGTQNSSIVAEDAVDANGNVVRAVVYAFALTPGMGNTHAYEAADVTAGRLRPQPIRGPQVGRTPVDHRYNCKAANACPDAGSRAPAIDDLRTAAGTTGVPAGFTTYTGPCKNNPNDPPVVVPSGNWYVNCASFDVSNSVRFTAGNVVFNGSVSVGSSGSLVLNDTDTADAWIYLRSGDLSKGAQGSLTLRRTMVYLHTGRISLGAGSGGLTWVAPFAGGFEDLALWSESSATHDLGGQSSLDVEGVFFTPNADPFRFTGQGAQYQAKAQFITYRLDVSGQGTLSLAPDPGRVVAVVSSSLQLIR